MDLLLFVMLICFYLLLGFDLLWIGILFACCFDLGVGCGFFCFGVSDVNNRIFTGLGLDVF